jgi:hypothetical protein
MLYYCLSRNFSILHSSSSGSPRLRRVRRESMRRGEDDRLSVEIFQTVDQHWAILFIEDVFADFDGIIRTYAGKVCIKCCVLEFVEKNEYRLILTLQKLLLDS